MGAAAAAATIPTVRKSQSSTYSDSNRQRNSSSHGHSNIKGVRTSNHTDPEAIILLIRIIIIATTVIIGRTLLMVVVVVVVAAAVVVVVIVGAPAPYQLCWLIVSLPELWEGGRVRGEILAYKPTSTSSFNRSN